MFILFMCIYIMLILLFIIRCWAHGLHRGMGRNPWAGRMKKRPPKPVWDVPFPLTEVRTGLFPLEVSTEGFLLTFHRNFVLLKPGGCTRGGAAMQCCTSGLL